MPIIPSVSPLNINVKINTEEEQLSGCSSTTTASIEK